ERAGRRPPGGPDRGPLPAGRGSRDAPAPGGARRQREAPARAGQRRLTRSAGRLRPWSVQDDEVAVLRGSAADPVDRQDVLRATVDARRPDSPRGDQVWGGRVATAGALAGRRPGGSGRG